MIKDCPFCGAECNFSPDNYNILCSNNACNYESGTAKDYELLKHQHNHLLPVSQYADLAEFIRYAPHHYDCAVEKWRQEFTKDSGPSPPCTCNLDSLKELFY